MNRSEFLKNLTKALEGMGEQDKQDALAYFDELISDKALDQGCSEEEAIANLGPIEEIAASIRQAEPFAQTRNAAGASAQGEAHQTGESSYGIKTVTAKAAGVRSVLIHTANTSIELQPGPDDEVILEYTQSANDIYDFSLKDGAMQLIKRPMETRIMIGFFFQYRRSSRIKLTVPADFASTCELTTGNSSISVRDVSFWSWLKCRSSNSSIHLERVKTQGDLTAVTSNSSCTLEDVQVKGKLDVRTSNGALTSHEIKGEAEVTFKTSNALISARKLQAKGPVTLESRNGRLEAELVSTPQELSLQTSNARISVQSVASPDIRLITSNGKVEGSILGKDSDYRVTSRTSNGRNNLSDHAWQGSKRLDVKTSNGNIQLQFAQEE